jgi:hypothetical protein
MYGMYCTTLIMLYYVSRADATLFNMSLLTSDVFSVLAGILSYIEVNFECAIYLLVVASVRCVPSQYVPSIL